MTPEVLDLVVIGWMVAMRDIETRQRSDGDFGTIAPSSRAAIAAITG